MNDRSKSKTAITPFQGPGTDIGDDRPTLLVDRLGTIGGHNASTDTGTLAH